jgi:hypothetical protein
MYIYIFLTYIHRLWDQVCQYLSPGTPVFSTNKTNRHDITEILLKVELITITHDPVSMAI